MKIGIGVICFFVVFVPALLSAGPLERENLNRASRILDGLSIPFEKRSLLAGHGGFGHSLLVRTGGAHSYQGTFVLAVPLDADFAVDTGLALAEKMQNQSSPVNIIVAFLGNERITLPKDLGGTSHKGLRDLLTLIDIPENWVLCYFDIAQSPGELLVRHGTRGYVAPLEILQPFASLLRSRSIPWSFSIRYNEIYKLGLVDGHEALSIAWEEEVNSFALAGRPASGETISPHDVAAILLEYAGSLDFPLLNVDRHYFFLTGPGGELVFFGQGFMVALLLIIAGVCFFLFLIYSARYNAVLLFHVRLFFKSIWIFFILLVLLVVSIMASGLLYSVLFRALGPPVPGILPVQAYYAGAGLTMLLAVLVFFLHSPVFGLIRIPKRAQFYGFSSVILVTVGLFIAAFLDFSFVPAFLWAFFLGFFAASLSRPVPVFIFVLLIPLFAINALFNIIETGSVRIAGHFIFPDWRAPDNWLAAFQVALFSLPLMLLVKRGIILSGKSLRRKHKARVRRRLIVVSVLLTAVLGTMLIQILHIPRYQLPPERRVIVEEPGTENEILTLSLENVIFQDSRILTLHIEARGSPVRFDVSLKSGNGLPLLPVHSALVPFQRRNDGRSIYFTLGEDPPNPFSMEIVLPRDFTGRLETGAVFTAWDPALDPGEKPGTDDYILRVSRTIDIGSNASN